MTSHTTSSPKAKKADSSASPLAAAEEAPTLNTNAHLVKDHSNREEQGSHQSGEVKGHEVEKEAASGDELEDEDEAIAKDEGEIDDDNEAPPLPNEHLPPLPAEAPPAAVPEEDDGWAPVWDQNMQAFYFYNRFTGASQWTNPRVPDPTVLAPPPGLEVATSVAAPAPEAQVSRPAGGYDPAIHGDYDPTAWYAQPAESSTPPPVTGTPAEQYAATGAFNRFTGRWQAADLNPENFNDENKSRRQMNAFFDVDAAANSHDGRSLKAERSGKKLSKTELKQFKEKRKAKKEEKRRAWLLD